MDAEQDTGPIDRDLGAREELVTPGFIWEALGLPGRPENISDEPFDEGLLDVSKEALRKVLEAQRVDMEAKSRGRMHTIVPQHYRKLLDLIPELPEDPPELVDEEGPEIDYVAILAHVRGQSTPEQLARVVENRVYRSWWLAECLVTHFEAALLKYGR